MHLSQRRNGDNLEIDLSGSWRGSELPEIDAELAAVPLDGTSTLRIRVPGDLQMDLAGAWRLRDWVELAAGKGVTVEFEGGRRPAQIELIDATVRGKKHPTPPSSSESRFEPVSALGRHVTRRWAGLNCCQRMDSGRCWAEAGRRHATPAAPASPSSSMRRRRFIASPR